MRVVMMSMMSMTSMKTVMTMMMMSLAGDGDGEYEEHAGDGGEVLRVSMRVRLGEKLRTLTRGSGKMITRRTSRTPLNYDSPDRRAKAC